MGTRLANVIVTLPGIDRKAWLETRRMENIAQLQTDLKSRVTGADRIASVICSITCRAAEKWTLTVIYLGIDSNCHEVPGSWFQ